MKTGGDEAEIILSSRPKCAHFYACICAFASDPKLSEEFNYYVNLIQLNIEDSLAIVQQNNEKDKIVGIGRNRTSIICICEFMIIFSHRYN